MPELPFLQVLAENLDREIRGCAVAAAELHSVSLLQTVDPPLSALDGRTLRGARRVAKLVILDVDGRYALVLHLMRDGRVQIGPPRAGAGKDLALALRLDDGREVRVVEAGPKKRASAYLLRAEALPHAAPLAGLGLDPFDPALTAARFGEMLRGEPGSLKHVLTLQRHVAGIGNAFSDEILWEARLSPFRPAQRLTGPEVDVLHGAIRRTLARAVEEHRTRFGEALPLKEPVQLLRVHRHAGEPCPRCGTPIARVAYAEKETDYCPVCQTGGKVYADRRLSRLLK